MQQTPAPWECLAQMDTSDLSHGASQSLDGKVCGSLKVKCPVKAHDLDTQSVTYRAILDYMKPLDCISSHCMQPAGLLPGRL